MDDSASRDLICEIGRRMYAKDLVAANEGNLSVRIGDRLLATPTGLCKGYMKPEDLVVTDLEGNLVSGRRKVSSEIKIHAVYYGRRPDVRAVCHAHPVYATSHAVAGLPLTKALMPEVVVSLGCVPVAPYATPSTRELAQSLEGLVESHDAVLLANHGAVTCGPDLEQAFFRMEILEHFAKIAILTKVLGQQTLLSESEVDRLFDLRSKYGITGPDFRQSSVCSITSGDESQEAVQLTRDDLIHLIETAIREVTGRS